MSTDDTRDPSALPQGDLRLLETDQARRLLVAAQPARYAYTATDGTPRVLPSWFHWTGDELVMPTFLAAPHIRRPARRLAALRAHPDVAVTIDTDTFPPQVLLLRGRAAITEVDGVVPEYAQAARRSFLAPPSSPRTPTRSEHSARSMAGRWRSRPRSAVVAEA